MTAVLIALVVSAFAFLLGGIYDRVTDMARLLRQIDDREASRDWAEAHAREAGFDPYER
jgi:hypothetical protein